MTQEVEKKLADRGVLVIPDFLANAGGVISSYCEWKGMNEKEMFKVVEEKITKNTKLVLSETTGGYAREAALKIAMQRVRGAMK